MSPVARFVVLDGPDSGQQHLIAGGQATLGRSLQCEIVLTDELASRQHARVSWQNGEWQLEDLGSRNGTFANGQPIQPQMPYPLFTGDQVRLANTVLGFEEIYDTGAPHDEDWDSHEPAPVPVEGGLHPLTYTMIGIAAVLLLVLLVLALLILIELS